MNEKKNKKSSWDYQKGRYKQITLKFFKENPDDMLIFHYLNGKGNKRKFILDLIREEMWSEAYYEK